MSIPFIMQENKMEGTSQTQRDLYYQVKSTLFATPVQVANGSLAILQLDSLCC